jgi:hypothetical protein
MSLKTRLTRLQKLIGPKRCQGPPIEFVEVCEGEEPPLPAPCPCGRAHPSLIRQIVVVQPNPNADRPEEDDGG